MPDLLIVPIIFYLSLSTCFFIISLPQFAWGIGDKYPYFSLLEELTKYLSTSNYYLLKSKQWALVYQQQQKPTPIPTNKNFKISIFTKYSLGPKHFWGLLKDFSVIISMHPLHSPQVWSSCFLVPSQKSTRWSMTCLICFLTPRLYYHTQQLWA